MTSAVDVFLEHRPWLVGIAYRVLGSAAEAEDVVQDAFVRWQAEPRDDVESPKSYLATVVSRLALDRLTSARRRRETYFGPWLPEPVPTSADAIEPRDPHALALAFMVVLETLSPLERVAFLLHDVFDYDHAEIAAILERDTGAVRQLVHRAREHVRSRRPRFAPSREEHARMLARFVEGCASGDPAQLASILAEDVVATSDGGDRRASARVPVLGRDRVARYLVGAAKKGARAGGHLEIREINGQLAAVAINAEGVATVLEIETDGERVHSVLLVLNPDKLRAIAP